MRGRLRALVVVAICALGGCTVASNAVPSRAPLVRVASATPQPLIFVGLSVNGQPGVAEFRRNANGNQKPVRTTSFRDILLSLFGADDSNNFWALFHKRNTSEPATLYAVHFSATFGVLGTVNVDSLDSMTVDSKGNVYAVVDGNTIVEYAAGSYGRKKLREIDMTQCCLTSTPQLAVDGSGNLYASAYPSTTNEGFEIAEWARKDSGSVLPERTIPAGSAVPTQIVADAAGDLYLAFGSQYGPADGIWRWAAGGTTPQWLLPGLPFKAFALDSAGNIYAEVPTIDNNFAVEVFSPGGQMIDDIAGTKTRLGYPSAITVAP